MAPFEQHRVAFVLIILYGCLAFQQVSGIALDQSEGQSKNLTTKGTKLTPVEGNVFMTEDGTLVELFPVSEPFWKLQGNHGSRRKLGDFLSCSSCKCCDQSGKTCQQGPCCFNINCNVQPYGTCKFVPFSCNCNGCGM